MLKENKLRAKIIEKNSSISEVSRYVGISVPTFYRKMNKNSFLVKEVDMIAEFLCLNAQEAAEIFFARNGA